ncbi:MAG: signal peptidase II [Deltaproteobacteria bacterium]|nr:signal peptidase II [Deltaproteobacteria bacterium]MBW2361965.1 signal peptidase II [Deltaproteobacteria bacterium]
MTAKLRVLSGVAAVGLVLDQITKYLIETRLIFGDEIAVIEGFFYLTRVHNRGAAFGILSNLPESMRLVFFVGITLIAVAVIISFFRKLAPGDRWAASSLGLILGGALGNLCDRVRLGEVVDFLHFKLWQGYSWPDFNLADSFIVVGVGLLILELIAIEGDEDEASESV